MGLSSPTGPAERCSPRSTWPARLRVNVRERKTRPTDRRRALDRRRAVLLMIQHAGSTLGEHACAASPWTGRVPMFYLIGLLSRERDREPRESRHSMVDASARPC